MQSEGELKVLAQAVREFCEARSWDQFHSAKDLAIGAVTEAAELLELFRFQSEAQIEVMLSDESSRHAIGEELADILFFLLRFAGRFNFDLSVELQDKISKNAIKYPVDKAKGNNRKYDQL